jgi:methylated-DNA-[protein]-cysteine S-methyltransferase
MNQPHSLTQSRVQTPLGEILIWASSQHLVGAWFLDQFNLNPLALQSPFASQNGIHQDASHWLQKYFEKSDPDVSDLPLQWDLASPLQRITWQALRDVKKGQTISYAALALKIGRPRSTRAVASAVAKNPFIIFLPCHRVIGSNGELRGYSAGLQRKKHLLELESQD